MKLPNFSIKNLATPKESKLFLSIVPTFKEKRTQEFTTLAFSLIVIAFFGLFAINPTFGTIVDLQRQISDDSFVDQQLRTKISNLTSLQTQYSKLQTQLTPVYAAVPTSPDIGDFAGQVHSLAAQTGVQINRLQTEPVDITPSLVAPAKSVAYSFTIEGQGLLPNIENYMEHVANFNRLITIDTVNYTRVGIIDSTFRVLIRGKAYFAPSQ